MYTRRRPARGFTLVELLIAITILAMVAVLGWRGLDGILRARAALNDELADTRGLQLGMAQLQTDCARLATPAMTGNRPVIDVAPERIMLVRTHYAEGQPGQLHVVRYDLHDGVLRRRQSAGTRSLAQLDALWQATRDAGANDAGAPALTRGIARLGFRLWDVNAGAWRDTAAAVAGQLSSALEVRLWRRNDTQPASKIMLLGTAD